MIPRISSKASPVKAITRIISSTLSLWKNNKTVWIINEPHLPEKRAGLDVMQSQPLCRMSFSQYQASLVAVCGEWGMRNAISWQSGDLSIQQVIWAYKLTFFSVLWLKKCNDHTVCTLHFYPCFQAQSSEEKDLDWVRWLVKNELTHKSAIGWGRDSQRTQEGWRREREEEEVFSPSGSLLPLRKCRSVSQSKITSSETLVEPIEPSSL